MKKMVNNNNSSHYCTAGNANPPAGKIICFVTLALLIILSIMSFSGCIKSEEMLQKQQPPETAGAASSAAELQDITVVLDWVPNTNHTGIYAAEELGYYTQEGLRVEIIQPAEGGSPDLIAAGRGQFGISYQEQVIYARTAREKLPVVAVAAIISHNTSGFASPVDRGIKTPEDFEGKRYGGWGSPMEEAMLKGLMEKYGADFTRIDMVNIGASDFFSSVARDVDFAWIYYGWDGVAAEVKDFAIDFMLLQDLDKNLDFYTPVIIASEETIRENPELLRKFLNATGKGYLYAINEPEKAAKILLKYAPELDSAIVAESQKYLAGKYTGVGGKWGYMESSIWETFSIWMYDNKLIPEKLDTGRAYTNSFLK